MNNSRAWIAALLHTAILIVTISTGYQQLRDAVSEEIITRANSVAYINEMTAKQTQEINRHIDRVEKQIDELTSILMGRK